MGLLTEDNVRQQEEYLKRLKDILYCFEFIEKGEKSYESKLAMKIRSAASDQEGVEVLIQCRKMEEKIEVSDNKIFGGGRYTLSIRYHNGLRMAIEAILKYFDFFGVEYPEPPELVKEELSS